MESNELRFRHVGLSSDGAVIFCEMDNGKTYAMPLLALEQAEDWNPKAKPKAAGIIHDGYAAFVEFDTGVKIDFPSDFVLHFCEPSYAYSKDKGRAVSGVGGRIREIREARGLTLDALAAKCGIAKPNLSRLENDKVTPTFETLKTIAKALDTHPALFVKKHAWTGTRHDFTQWKLGLLWNEANRDSRIELVRAVDMVKVFLATRPEHRYARMKLLKHADRAPHDAELVKHSLDADKWAREVAAAEKAQECAKRGKEPMLKSAHSKVSPMPDKPEGQMPETVAVEWNAIWPAVCDLHAMWELYAGLYGNKGHARMMNDTLPGVFALIHRALRNEILMGVGRLLDPAESRIKEEVFPNLSLARLLVIVRPHCPPDVNSRLGKMLKDAKTHCEQLLVWRHKRVGHADREAVFKIKKLPNVEQKDIEKALKMLYDLLKEIHTHFNGQETVFHFPRRVGDADALMSLIKDGVNAREAEIASMFP